jgi:hypothetical protein
MRYENSRLLLGVISALASVTVWGQQAKTAPAAAPAPAPAPAAAQAAPQSISSSLGVIVFPSKNQTPTQQASDEGTCFAWAKTNTGIDPMAPPPPVAVQPTQDPATAGQGAGARGAVRGAAGGAAIGAIAGDAGKGAAIGATVGVMSGGANRRAAKQQAAEQGQQAQANAAAQSQAISAQQKATFNKGFSACMEGKGYTSK